MRVSSIRGNSREVLAAVAGSFWKQEDEGQQGLSKTTQKMVQANPWAIRKERSEHVHLRKVALGEMTLCIWHGLQATVIRKSGWAWPMNGFSACSL